jgi:hypothetical protein
MAICLRPFMKRTLPCGSIYQAPEDVPEDGPARVLLGSYGSASSAIASPSPINYLAVRLKAGKRWRYEPFSLRYPNLGSSSRAARDSLSAVGPLPSKQTSE